MTEPKVIHVPTPENPAPKPLIEAGEQRFYFVPCGEEAPEYWNVWDNHQRSFCATWPVELTMPLGMMYAKMLKEVSVALANEFMYGAVLGYNMTLVNADKLVKVEKHMSEDKRTMHLKFTNPDGSVSELVRTVDSEDISPLVREMTSKAGIEVPKPKKDAASDSTFVQPDNNNIQ